MKVQPTYQIQHIPLEKQIRPPVLDDHQQGFYLVFWWKDIPLGHKFVEPKQKLSEGHYQNLLTEAVCPALQSYASKKGQLSNDWKHPLLEQNLQEWNDQMESILTEHLPSKRPQKVPVSVIVCTSNRACYLQCFLESLFRSSCLPGEIIVVDNAPTDDSTFNTAKHFANVVYAYEPKPGLSIARNKGLQKATQPIVAFSDDDVVVHPDWVYRVWKTFTNPKTMAMTGLVVASELQTEAQQIFEKYWSFNRGYVDKTYDTEYFETTLAEGPPVWKIGAGANMAFRKSAFEEVGLFNESLGAGASGCSEDSEMWYRLLIKGYSINYNPRAVVFHKHRKEADALKKQIFNYMRGFTAAALLQQNQYPKANYKKHLLQVLSKYYAELLIEGFPLYRYKYCTVWPEVRGLFSGLAFYNRNRSKLLKQKSLLSAHPLVTVIIPCYNHGHFLQEAVESVLQQTYPAIETIVVDDGSTDNTRKVVQQYKAVKYVYQRNKGLASARNAGIRHSCGDFLVFLDSDDFLYRDAVEVNLEVLRKNERLAFVAGSHNRIYTYSTFVNPVVKNITSDHYIHLLRGNYIGMHATVMFRRWVFDKHQYDTSLKACEDYDLYLKIARNHPVEHHGNIVAAYRFHERNMSDNLHLMITTSQKALKRQKKNLRNSKEQSAYAEGLIFWKDYYMQLLYERLKAKEKLSKGDFQTLLKYDRPLLYNLLYQQYTDKAMGWAKKYTPPLIKDALRVYWQRK